jgi:AraC-like DNA-binding protein
LQRARSLLRSGQPIAYVAMDLGFSDQPHLCRQFKNAFGQTPGKIQICH